MRINNIEVNNYRRFKNVEIKLGKHITCLAGHNAVGKSTLLGLLGHCGEFKKSDGSTLFGQAFRAHLNEIVKFSNSFDLSGNDLYTITFEDLPTTTDVNSFPPTLSFRAYWAEQKTRYKLIPMLKDGRTTERKVTWPTFYLGLSRLYPIGESAEVNETKNTNKLDETDKQFIYQHYKNILSSTEKYTDITSLSITEVTKKKSIGVSTNSYDFLTNSAGQDNLGQILMSVLSFKKLKESNPKDWSGGLLLIDEIDATLHPAAQNKLLDFLYRQAKNIGIQIVFTTHSLSLLEHLSTKIKFNDKQRNNDTELCYLTTANSSLQVLRNPEMSGIYYDLMSTYQGVTPPKQIVLYSEDAETRWFFDHLIRYANTLNSFPKMLSRSIKALEIKLGCNQLLTLLSQDFQYFKNCIFLLDGDVTSDEINGKIKSIQINYSESLHAKNKVILKLPGNDAPEKILYSYIESLEGDSEFFSMDNFHLGITKRSLMESGPTSNVYSHLSKEREKYKEWFNQNIYVLDKLIQFWIKENEKLVVEFIINLESVYNFAANNNNLPTVSYGAKLLTEAMDTSTNSTHTEVPV